MNNRHKYFRNLRYKQKLETKYDNGNRNIYFITNEPDPRAVRESNNFYLCHPEIDPAEWERAHGHDYYISWKRPEIPYTAVEWNEEYGYKKFCKKYSNKIVRRSKNDFQHNGYRREFDLRWTID
jgi:hypothetical protein